MIAESADGYPYWGPLMPIVEFCLERGCKLSTRTPKKPFYEDRNGSSSCSLIGAVTTQDIIDNFSLPDHIETGKISITDTKHRSSIRLLSAEEFEKISKEREAKNEKRKKKLLESRRRRADAIQEAKTLIFTQLLVLW